MSVGISIGIGEDKDGEAAVLLTISEGQRHLMAITMSSDRAQLYGAMLCAAGRDLEDDEIDAEKEV